MNFYTKQHKYYCEIYLHARTIYIFILDQTGKPVFQRNRKASPVGGGNRVGLVYCYSPILKQESLFPCHVQRRSSCFLKVKKQV